MNKLRLALVAVVSATGCGPELDRISELSGLRVLAVQKDTPYAAPDADVEFRMLWEDAAEGGPRATERFWIGGCSNPPGDLYAGCFAQWFEVLAAAQGPEELATLVGDGDRFVTRSAPIRDMVQDPRQPPYGIGYVFFGVCAGRLDWAGWNQRVAAGAVRDLGSAFPYCLDPDTGEVLGPNDYVVGYSSVYSYAEERFRNANPVLGDGPAPELGEVGVAFRVNGEPVAHDCVGQACVCPTDPAGQPCTTPFPVPELTGCEPGVACIDACPQDGDPACPEIDLRPVLDPARNVEADLIARETSGRDVEESAWISYFVDRGALRSQLRLLNDGATGWNDDYSAKLYAPREPGPLRIWAVVRDNRGGVNWVRVPAYVR